jgi:hypothetical protein
MTQMSDSDRANNRILMACGIATVLICEKGFGDSYGECGCMVAGVRDMVRGALAVAAITPDAQAPDIHRRLQRRCFFLEVVERVGPPDGTVAQTSCIQLACTGLPLCHVLVDLTDDLNVIPSPPPAYPDTPSCLARLTLDWEIQGSLRILMTVDLTSGAVSFDEPACVWQIGEESGPVFVHEQLQSPVSTQVPIAPAPQPWTLDESLDMLLLFMSAHLAERVWKAEQVLPGEPPTGASTSGMSNSDARHQQQEAT